MVKPLSRNPEKQIDEKKAGDFIQSANTNSQGPRPWDNADDRIKKGFNLRLTESQWLKLKYISEQTPDSIHSFIMKVLEPAIEKKIKELK